MKIRTFSDTRQSHGVTAIDGVIALVVILLVVQIWLLSATLDLFLAGHKQPALPAAIASGTLFGVCFLLYRLVRRVDRDARSESQD